MSISGSAMDQSGCLVHKNRIFKNNDDTYYKNGNLYTKDNILIKQAVQASPSVEKTNEQVIKVVEQVINNPDSTSDKNERSVTAQTRPRRQPAHELTVDQRRRLSEQSDSETSSASLESSVNNERSPPTRPKLPPVSSIETIGSSASPPKNQNQDRGRTRTTGTVRQAFPTASTSSSNNKNTDEQEYQNALNQLFPLDDQGIALNPTEKRTFMEAIEKRAAKLAKSEGIGLNTKIPKTYKYHLRVVEESRKLQILKQQLDLVQKQLNNLRSNN